MNKGFCILAENNYKTDYVRQAYALACSIHKNNKNQYVSLITDDDVPKQYENVFDKIIPSFLTIKPLRVLMLWNFISEIFINIAVGICFEGII